MRILITAGPTREAIDPVRYISNRSSGKMGYATAAAAADAGHEVTIVSGPVSLSPPENVTVIHVESAQQMFDSVAHRIGSVDVAIMTAAVADYRPATIAAEKIKKSGDTVILTLEKTQDILGSARTTFGFRGLLVGFAAETTDVEINALNKLARKGCNMIIANDVSRPGIGFDSDQNAVTIFFADGRSHEIAVTTKLAIGSEIIRLVEKETSSLQLHDGSK
ncbi:MAG: phosphopantothenoylcysteine decarboxylase [Verrucomicrobiae bacterium]|nr:phosphopantothenoylcysteine decarboxylase [Verrucomicrobiae bacterium]